MAIFDIEEPILSANCLGVCRVEDHRRTKDTLKNSRKLVAMKTRALLAVALLLVISTTVSAQKKEKPLGPNAIPAGTTIFIEPNEGFDTYLMAAFQKAKVPLLIVTERGKAALVLTSALTSGKEPGIAAGIFLGQLNPTQDATVMIVDPQTSTVRYSHSVRKYAKQAAAEAIAKGVKKKIDSRQ